MSKNRIILNRDIIQSTTFCPSVFKYTSKNDFDNYFYAPNMAIKLYYPKVSWMDNNSISFVFDKTENENLLNLIKEINERLINSLSQYIELRGHSELSQVPCIYFEKPDLNCFYIKCNIPNTNGRFFVNCMDNENNSKRFIKPSIGFIYNHVILDIRNVWKTGNKIGFRLELKDAVLN